MTHAQLINVIEQSSHDAWLHDDSAAVFTLKSDLNVTIREKRGEDDEADFAEEWTQGLPDKDAKKIQFDLYYGASFVQRFYLVAVDGYRAYLPMPAPATKVIPLDKYHLARAVDSMGRLDEYIARCGLKVG